MSSRRERRPHHGASSSLGAPSRHTRSYSVRARPPPAISTVLSSGPSNRSSTAQHQHQLQQPRPHSSYNINHISAAADPRNYRRGHSWHNVESASLDVYRAKDDDEEIGIPSSADDELNNVPKKTQFKNCCRQITTFMCTQVGVGGLIVFYAIMGAVMFIALETEGNPKGNEQVTNVSRLRNTTARILLEEVRLSWNEEDWETKSNLSLKKFQDKIVEEYKKGYDGRKVEEKWTFPSALMFTLSIFTMIGYGNLVPRTDWGKVITIFYAVFGIPLYVLYFLNMGRALAKAFKWIYIKLSSCKLRRSAKNLGDDYSLPSTSKHGPGSAGTSKDSSKDVLVPSTASVYVLIVYIAIGTIMFAEWEGWEYLDSVYFCVISLCKIGLGDFVPGTNIQEGFEANQTKLIINFIYLLLGLGLVAMCYNLLKEEVLAKMKELKSDVKYLISWIRNECGHCTGGHVHIPGPGIEPRRTATTRKHST